MDIAAIDVRYQIQDKLGAGSMGLVYRALDRLTGRSVALKKVNIAVEQASPVDEDLRLALAHEFQALASLRHPHIVTVLDYGFDAGDVPYLVMELLENARTICEAGQKQPLRSQVALLIQMLQALAYLHRRGIVHRDLKPGNVLVSDGQLKVLDFGLAATRGESIGTAGTLNYMAPEILTGHAADVFTDLYGVGMIAYEMFAGHHLYKISADVNATLLDPQQLVNQIMATPPTELTADVDAPIAAILSQLLAKNPADRYASAGEVIEAFNALLDDPLPYETAGTRESFLQAAEFVGRDEELSKLRDALAHAVAGRGNVWLVAGESGVGKSRLVEELRVRALVQGILVLRGQAISEGGQPYQSWRDVLRWLCLQTSLTVFEASVLKILVPDIGTLLGIEVPDPPKLDPQATQERLVSLTESIFERQTRPILILLEDLQWAGSEGLALLARLSRRVSAWPLLIVGNYRDDERSDLPVLVPNTQTLKLNRLAEADIARLSESMLGAAGQKPHVVNLLQEQTEGNIYFLIEMVRALAEEAGSLADVGDLTLPHTISTGGVRQFILRRLSRVPTEAHPLLRLAAIAGRDLDLKVLGTIDAEVNLAQWLTACADAAVLEALGEHWRFAHDKLREMLLAEVPSGQRAAMHAQVAGAIETAYPDTSPYARALTYHWSQAENTPKTIQYAATAGEQSLSIGAYKEAVEFYEQVLALSAGSASPLEAATTEYQVGMAYYGLANMESSRSHMLRALELLGWEVPTLTSRLYRALAKELVLQTIRPTRFLERYSVYPREVLLLAARICAHLTQIGFFSGSMLVSALHTIRAVNIAEAGGISPELARSYAQFALAIGLIPLTPLAQHYSDLAVSVGRAANQPATLGFSLYVLGFYQTTVANWDKAHAYFQEAVDILSTIGDRRRWREALANFGYMYGLQGKFAESYKLRRELELAAEREDDIQARGWGLAGMGEMALWLHHTEDAFNYLQARIDLLDKFVDVLDPTTPCVAMLALAFWRAGQPGKAREQAVRGLEHMALLKNGAFHSFHGFASLAEVYLRMWEAQPDDAGLAETACQVTTALQAFSRRFVVYHAWSWRNYGMYLALSGDQNRAAKAWQKSLAVAQRLELPFDEALVRYEIGRHLPTDNPSRRGHLQRAIDIFADLDAAYDLAQAQAALAQR